MSKPINMATGGLMSMPPYIRANDESDKEIRASDGNLEREPAGIGPYDINTPASARKGLPARLLGKERTRFSKGGNGIKPLNPDDIPILEEHPLEPSDTKYVKLNVAEKLLYKNLKAMDESGVLDEKGKKKLKKLEQKKNTTALGGLMNRQGLYRGDKPLLPSEIPILEEHDDSGIVPSSDKVAGGNAARDHHINKMITKLENRKEMVEAKDAVAIDNQIKKLEKMKSSNIKTAALGGYMDENDIAEQTPLALNIGGAVGRREERKDYQAYAEGDVVEDDIIEDEALLSPLGIEEEDALAETDLEMTAEDEALGDADAVLDTSMLSEEEEIVLDEAMEMHPELESIIPKIVATEFTEDELVEGPGDGTSDSIPAMLSDGEFVFTAKAVKSLGVDKLRKMMAQAEEAYDAGQIAQEDSAAQFEADSLLA